MFLDRRQFHEFLLGVSSLTLIDRGIAAPANPLALDLAAEKKTYQKNLFDDFLPFMEKNVIDHEYGGFMCSVRPNGERVSTAKRTWFEGRGTWVYSFLYNNLAREQKYLDVAEHSIKLLRRSTPQRH